MRKITQTIVGTTPPTDKNVLWLDTTNSNSPVEKAFLNGAWILTSAAGGNYYTKDEVDENFMGKIDDPNVGNILVMDENGKAVDSTKKVADFIANPEVSGQNGEVLSIDSEGNPIWATITPSGVMDTEMSDVSENPVQNRIIKSYVDDNYARKDGYYSQMTVGSAENLVGQTVDSEAYLIRPTGGNSNDVAKGVAYVLGMEGNSVVVNQLVTNGNFANGTTGWTKHSSSLSASNGVLTAVSSDGTSFFGASTSVNSLANHKYYISILSKASESITVYNIYVSNLSRLTGYETKTLNTSWERLACLFSASSTTTCNVGLRNYTKNIGHETSINMKNVIVLDLTLMGIDNLTTTDQVEAWLAKNIGSKPYYAYNPGTLLGVQYRGLKALKTPNLLNPTTKIARLFEYTYGNATNKYTISNLPTGATLYFTPDNTGVEEEVTMDDATHFTIASQGTLRVDTNDSVINTWLIAYWDGSMDDYSNFEPYQENSNVIDTRYIYYDNNGVKTKVWTDGVMKATGSSDSDVRDKLYVDGDDGKWKADVPMMRDEINLGNLTWTKSTYSGIEYYRSNAVIGIKKPSSNSQIIPLITTTNYFPTVAATGSGGTYTFIAIDINGKILINKPYGTYADGDAFKAAMTGQKMWTVANTPVHHDTLYYSEDGENFTEMTLDNYPNGIIVNNWTYEETLVSDYSNNNPTSTSATIKTQYGVDAVEAIDTLQKTCYFADDVKANLQALLTCINTNCSATLGGTFSISETVTDKVFEFTFTSNTQPEP